MKDLDKLKFDKNGLIPAIVQDWRTKKVLMLGYMNQESLNKSIQSGECWFYSRSRQELWHKGETSGNLQKIKAISYDCDGDAILVEVIPAGPACHTGEISCFFQHIIEDTSRVSLEMILNSLYTRILERRMKPVEGSYTNYLFKEGLDKILKKVGEEAAEVIITAKNQSKEDFINEMADLIYHLSVLTVEKECIPDEIGEELADRFRINRTKSK